MRSRLGYIRELGPKHYEVSVVIGINPKTGKQRRKHKTVRGSKKEAQRQLNLLATMNNASVESTELTVAEYANNVYLPKIEKEIERRAKTGKGKYKQTTYDYYECQLRLHIIPFIGRVKMSDIKPRHIRLVEEQAETQAAKIAVHKAMSAMFREATYDDIMEANPVDAVRPPEHTDYEPVILDAEDLSVYLWHFQDTRIEPVVLLAIGGAYRRGEIVALDVDDINLETGWVTIDDEVVNSSVGVITEAPKNNKKRRNRLPQFITERLKLVLPKSGPVMQTESGERMMPSGVRSLYNRTLKTLPEGVPRIPLKNLRHSSLTMVYDATGNIERSKDHGGHLDKAVTERHYVRAHDDQENATADAMDSYIRGILPVQLIA